MTRDQHNPRDESLVHKAAQDARATEARMLPNAGDLTKDQIEYVRQCVNARCDEQGLTYEQIDKKIACARKAVRRFMEGTYEHDDSNFARRLDNWLKNSDPNLGGMPTKFVSTEVANKMIGLIVQVYQRKSMGTIVGPSGVSKSTVLTYIAAGRIAGSVHIELNSTDKTISQILRRIAGDLGLADIYTKQRLMQNIIKLLKGTDRLIMLDEAHYMDKNAMNAVRDIHKATGCPIMLVGTDDMLKTIDDFTEFHGQMKSLLSMHYNITVEANQSGNPIYTVDEIFAYAKEMGIKLTIDGASRVADLASTLGWGGLRSAAYLMLNANIAYRGKALTEKHINSALLEMEGYDGFQRTKYKTDSSRKVAVA